MPSQRENRQHRRHNIGLYTIKLRAAAEARNKSPDQSRR
jgi:hypothetical protein